MKVVAVEVVKTKQTLKMLSNGANTILVTDGM